MGHRATSPQRHSRLLAVAVLAGCLADMGVTAAFGQAPEQYGVLAYLQSSAVGAFDVRHQTDAVRLNPNRNLYLITVSDGRTDQQLLSEVATDPVARHPELNRPVSLGGPTSDLDAAQSTASVLNGGQSTASVLNSDGDGSTLADSSPGQDLGLRNGHVLTLNIGLFGSQAVLGAKAASVLSSQPRYYHGSLVPAQYVDQPVVGQIHAGASALRYASGRHVVVALIDNGLDPTNPVLTQTWTGEKGWNFYDNSPDWSAYADLADGPQGRGSQISLGGAVLDGGSGSTPSTPCSVEFNNQGSHLDQSTASVLNGGQSTASVLNGEQSTASVLNGGQSTASVLNDAESQTQALAAVNALLACDPDFGHGTSVAGLIHLVAPDAKILPIKAFGPGGTATAAAIYQSITYAIDQHVQVINMSFSATASTPAIEAAIREAVHDSIVVVAAAGNSASDAAVFPASLPGVMGVGAVDGTQGQFPLAWFSNFDPGPGQIVDAGVAAPGVSLFTTYPGGGQIWATVSGTSFSTPLVAGAAALLAQRGLHGKANRAAIGAAADPAIAGDAQGQVGAGLINVQQALAAAGAAHAAERDQRHGHDHSDRGDGHHGH